ncbi:hypothetical protein COS31_01145 [Candidatus Roizmanbacteria bacterium CG02_land_8_20_14_3_00_36_15]|uniref:Uncharacterized protein n=2 Tax=Candidatus Roizmaniibacteriota TaxID=1752723 RepID=A0A2M8KMQ6_9BACT|nr:MAG: hypothetical protein COS51_04515 [Candidatus Roizmanbacteria bacterium CG03_land_8_20_14_0_80_36_21]PIV38111.1 MAG: hypothetical protein COS31_01145 [Candidatus Roizmanbacteria bacterium CG02_land_8_20_14_3_00_36_15]PIY70247.1 MAG: hypothetical protein COY89_02160 [Candidatus Roizmanbacteria bacterium CG_4_10_14_0_8_um_filter_36_36]PJA52499.1 MAG: hypothetical protein CO166_05565 [Candidatus Roizmanbacteria bacterium CG_4_9_14_3_um_filter_36_11]PJC81756.1 MAG: hypothetical protein CO007
MTLTELSYYSRRALPIGIIFLLILLILFYLFKLFFIYLNLNTHRQVYTNPVFGKISSPQLKQPLKTGQLSYILDTVEGTPISASEAAKVYFLPSPTTKFGYREKIYLIAKNLGFDTTSAKYTLIGKEASFSDQKQQLTVDITNFNFSYQYQFTGEEEFFLNNYLPASSAIENRSIDFLKNLDRYPTELAQGKTNLIYLKFDQQTKSLAVVENPNQANMIEVDFYRPDIDSLPTVSPSYFNSQNYLVIIFFGEEYKVLKAQISFFEKSEGEYGVYPLKSGELSWQDLKAGKGIIISPAEAKGNVVIKRMFLGYFDPSIYQEYLQPVYVFLGDNNFVGYVPAVADEYLVSNGK